MSQTTPTVSHITVQTPTPRDLEPSNLDEEGFLSMKTSAAAEELCNLAEIIEEIVDIYNVTVKFRISDAQVIAQVYPNRMSIGDVKKDIARKFEVNVELLRLSQCEREVSDECLLLECDSDEFGIHEFKLELEKPVLKSDSDESIVLPKLDLNIYYRYNALIR